MNNTITMKRIIATTALVLAVSLLLWLVSRPTPRIPVPRVSDQIAYAVAKSFAISDAPITIKRDAERGRVPRDQERYVNMRSTVQTFVIGYNSIQVLDDRFRIDSFYGPNHEVARKHKKKISQTAMLRTARAYALAHFPSYAGPIRAKSVVINSIHSYDDHGAKLYDLNMYSFCFYSAPASISACPNRCYVEVEDITGRVVTYIGFDYALSVSTRPSISAKTAMNDAMGALVSDGHPIGVKELAITNPDQNNVEHLAYIVTFSGMGPSYDDYSSDDDPIITRLPVNKPLSWLRMLTVRKQRNNYFAAVDAHSGEFLGWGFTEDIPPVSTEL